MLVGDVRWATTGFGSSWKLSGGSQWSVGPTNVSKKLQVWRATRRSSFVSAGASGTSAVGGDWLTQYPTSGARNQASRNGAATGRAAGFTSPTISASAMAPAGDGHMVRQKFRRSV